MSDIIIVGYKSYIGRALAQYHMDRGDMVFGIGHTYDPSEDQKRFKVVPYDIAKEEGDLSKIDHPIDYLYDLAWSKSSSARERKDFAGQYSNILMTRNVLNLCKKIGCGRMLFASSIIEREVLGDAVYAKEPFVHTAQMYGVAKLSAHLFTKILAKEEGIDFIPLLISNIFGVGEKSLRLINTTIRDILAHKHVGFSAATQLYDFIYLKDAVAAMAAVAEKGHPFETYYIGSGNIRPLKEYLLELIETVDPDADYSFGEVSPTSLGIDYDHIELNKVQKDTSFTNRYTFKEGIAETAKWIAGGGLDEE